MMMTVCVADGACCRGELGDLFAGELTAGDGVPGPVGAGLGAPDEAPDAK
jgi:hypothetical protein